MSTSKSIIFCVSVDFSAGTASKQRMSRQRYRKGFVLTIIQIILEANSDLSLGMRSNGKSGLPFNSFLTKVNVLLRRVDDIHVHSLSTAW